jgi:hypothetical protein
MDAFARRLAWMTLGGLFVLLLCHQWFGPDIWYHLYLGQRILHTGSAQPTDNLIFHQARYVNTYWLFQVGVRELYAAGGLTVVSFLFLALWGAALGVWLATTRLRRAGAWSAVAALAAVLMCQTRFEQRPEVLSYVFLALQIYWLTSGKLEMGERKAWVGFLAVQIVWSNVHSYFALGPLLVGTQLAAALIQSDPTRRPGRLARLLALTVLATFVSPFGWRNWEEVVVLARFFRQMHHSVQEFLPPTQVPVFVWGIRVFEVYWWAILAGGAAVALRAARSQAFALLLAALGLILGMSALRNIPLLVFLSAPLLAALAPILTRLQPPARATPLAVAAGSLLLAASVLSGQFYRSTGGVPGFGLRESRYAYPVLFCDYLPRNAFAGSVFNNPGDGGYLEFHFPKLRLYADTRFVEAAPIREYFEALAQPAALAALDQRQHFDALLLRVTESPYVISHWLRQPGWKLAYADLHRAFLVNRHTSAGDRAISRRPQLYAGEDLAVPINGASATAWAGIFVLAEDRPHLLVALNQFNAAPGVPPGLVKFAREYGQGHSDPEISALAEQMSRKQLP